MAFISKKYYSVGEPAFKPTLAWLPFIAFSLIVIFVMFQNITLTQAIYGTDPDNYLRAVQVRDWLQGAGWFNTGSMQVDAPYGANVFSRLIDIPLAIIAYPLSQMMPLLDAIYIASFIIPLFLILPLFIFALGWAYAPLVGEKWKYAGLLLPLCYPRLMAEFMPGCVDHHGWQLLLMLVMLGHTLRILIHENEKNACKSTFLLAFFIALSIAIGVETLPFIIAILFFFGIKLWLQPVKMGRVAVVLGAAMPLFTAAFFFALVAPDKYMDEIFYKLSYLHVVLFGYIGAVFVLGGLLAPKIDNLIMRGGVLSLIAALPVAALFYQHPILLEGLWAGHDPWMQDFTRENTNEQKPLTLSPANWVGFAWANVMALIGFVAAYRHRQDRLVLFMLIIITLSASAGALFYANRIDRFALMFGIPLIALFLKYTYQLIEAKAGNGRKRYALEFALFLLAVPLAGFLSIGYIANDPVRTMSAFLAPQAKKNDTFNILNTYLKLAYPEPKRILVSQTIGPQIIIDTNHIVFGGAIYNTPYGLKMSKAFFGEGDERMAANVLMENDIDLIIITDVENYQDMKKIDAQGVNVRDSKGKIARMLMAGKPPAWLTREDILFGKNIMLYRVDKAKLERAGVDAPAVEQQPQAQPQ